MGLLDAAPPPAPPPGLLRRLVPYLLALPVLAVGLIGFQNSLLNLALPHLINARPERLRIDYTAAWMIVPGHVHVVGLRIRNQGPGDQWLIAADSASGVIYLRELFDRQFHAEQVVAKGLSIRYRRRVDAKGPGDTAEVVMLDAPGRVEASHEPPIDDLTNPPNPNPDVIYPKAKVKWLIALDDVHADTVREIWIGDYRLTGDASVEAAVLLAGPFVDVEGRVSLVDMRADIGDTRVADGMVGDVSILIDSMDRADLGSDKLQSISGEARISADVQDLRFVDFYLAAVPWLKLAGVGHIDADVGLQEGMFRMGSKFEATFPELVVRFLGNDVTGAGKIFADVTPMPEGEPQSRITVAFDDFAITPDGTANALVEGTGFRIDADSPDVRLDQPFTSVNVVLDLPESRIPDIALYNAYLPHGIGLSLRDGTGTVRGHLEASSVGSRASGDVHFVGDDVVLQLDAIAATADVALHARLAEAKLDTGWYDLSGTTFDLRHVGMIDKAYPNERDGQRRWSASMTVPSGVIHVAAPVYLDTVVRLRASDSVPFVTVFADQKSLPGWVQKRLSVPNVSGEARLQFGPRMLEVGPCQIRGGDYEVDLRYLRDGPLRHGDLVARAGPLSVGVALRPDGPELQLFGAQRWFESRGLSPSRP